MCPPYLATAARDHRDPKEFISVSLNLLGKKM